MTKLAWMVLMPSRHVPPTKKLSGEQVKFWGDHSQKIVGNDEIAKSGYVANTSLTKVIFLNLYMSICTYFEHICVLIFVDLSQH